MDEPTKTTVMKERLLKLLLVMLGFGTAACTETEDLPELPVEYGCPMSRFSIKAKVTDTSDRPVDGIRVEAVRYSSSGNADVSFDPNEAYSDTDGALVLNAEAFGNDTPPLTVTVKVEDVDGLENGGQFAGKEVEVNVTENDMVDSGTWVNSYSVDAGDIVLDKSSE